MNKLKNSINAFIKNDGKRLKIAVIIGIFGVLMILSSSMFSQNTGSENKLNNELNYSEYVNELENDLKAIISSIDGVGKCEIMITLENSAESVYATDNEQKEDDSVRQNKDEYVLYDNGSSESPVLIKEYMPKVQGVSVVCSGGDNAYVKEQIVGVVTSLFNISANRVSVSKIK